MSLAAGEFQKALYQILVADVDLISLLGGNHIHDHATHNAKFPQIVFGRTTSIDWGADESTGELLHQEIEVLDKGFGRKKALEIMARIETLLKSANLVLATMNIINFSITNTQITHLPRANKLLGKITLRAAIEYP